MADLVVRCLGSDDVACFAQIAEGLFDRPIDPALLGEFLADPRHHIAVAMDGGLMVGFVSGLHYIHPDKPAELWINEVSVAVSHRRRGLGKAMLAAMMARARELGCREAWVLTEAPNAAARALYRTAGGAESEALMVSYDLTL